MACISGVFSAGASNCPFVNDCEWIASRVTPHQSTTTKEHLSPVALFLSFHFLSLEAGITRTITTTRSPAGILRNTAQEFYPKMNSLALSDEDQELSFIEMGNIDLFEKIQAHASHSVGGSCQVRNSPPSDQPPKAVRKARNHPQQWESLKEAIRQIYIDQDNTLGTTMQIVEAKHGFTARQVLIC
jgi:hypothetical protein